MHKQRVVFVHGLGSFGAAAWPKQHGMALSHDALFLRRHGFDATADPLESNVAADMAIIINALRESGGGHVVAHEQGAISSMLTAIERPDLVWSLTLVEPACLSLTSELPATASHRSLMEPLFAVRNQLNDSDYQREYYRRAFSAEAGDLDTPEARRSARRLRLQAPPWEAPLQIVPGVPTLVLTGGWEPLYEEIAGYLRETGAVHRVAAGGHRPQDSADGDRIIRSFVADAGRGISAQAS
ncbi:alpha/beta fold hydrolase [Paenarthrobacter ilicis]|uniref:Pimeloyl-ACP methyl ester carboxylesterase n=1 Tax=Paenarthrobacter ilicis TaxID=43665 RepID=A0ABX0TB46_9MICC|nr:alpha/beta hydrolase [Paenarthrobacter ilicis]MBM7793546.1 pimeloyl-ACP methyl ester carboxylesterase [Paenarthrobacter ilicis]NII99726.1 pimeloyl-ACP methyl ester carboxylesterase [Paenarthrobacter ilicis]